MRRIGSPPRPGLSASPWLEVVAAVLATAALFALALPWIESWRAPSQPEAAPLTDASTEMTPGAYRADLMRVVDGDTVEMQVHVWIGQEIRASVRLRGIDAPELHARCDAERRAAEAARDRLKTLVGKGPLIVANPSPDKYFGRVLAELKLGDGRDVGRILLSEHLARPYQGGTRQGWCDTP